ncbi:hypothetical protein ND748_18125 [Frankia sp. AiPs1]|uniref:hypothetical protein n=1 Tax=Frankia sp. AiPs1 TaxID=573493 RepID=UPI00204482B7|nr:hypothetical protein [Frankia sp. AiPs1]MCM3923574.1 hypothetical protein [Frankia sp. AiPs1]
MSDLRTLLHEAADAAPVAPTLATVDGDLARGRRVLARNRRIRWTVVPTTTGLVAALAGALIAGPRLAADSPSTVASTVATAGPSSRGPVAGTDLSATISLVAYRGVQPVGYTIDKVPDGWQIQNVNRYSLVIARVGATDKDPTSFIGKILIGKANPDEVAVPRAHQTTIRVGGVAARLFTFPDPQDPAQSQPPAPDSGTRGLLLPAGRDSYLIFQIPGQLHWDAATVADFAAGVHMTASAQAALG